MKNVVIPDKSITEKPKARLVAGGFQQVLGMNCNDAYAPVVKFTPAVAVIAFLMYLHLDPHQMAVLMVL